MSEQIVITLCGIASIWLSQAPLASHRRWAPIIGLCAQPAWLYAAIKAQQWGIAGMTLVYAAGWVRGLKTYWFTKAPL